MKLHISVSLCMHAGNWLSEHTDLRDDLNTGELSLDKLRGITHEMTKRVEICGRDCPIPKLSQRKLAALERDAALRAAKHGQQIEEIALQQLDMKVWWVCKAHWGRGQLTCLPPSMGIDWCLTSV